MYKIVEFPGVDETGNVFVETIQPEAGLTKTASELHPEIQGFIRNMTPDDNKLRVLINALGAGEYYGSNVNGDYFEEDQLLGSASRYKELDVRPRPFGYKTFLDGGIYRHHKNKDPSISMGKIVVSVYNPRMHRVELVVEIDKRRTIELGHEDLVDALERGEHPAVSMGTRVPIDICTYCGHRSKTRNDYCEHARRFMGKIMPNGVRVAVLNPRPKFFDISFVIVGADKTSYAMYKFASAQPRLSADLAAEAGLEEPTPFERMKKAEKGKIADLFKRIPANIEILKKRSLPKEHPLPPHILKKLSAHPLDETLTTLSGLGIVLQPAEFQTLVLTKLGHAKLAERYACHNEVFAPTEDVDKSIEFGKIANYSPAIAGLVEQFIDTRSVFEPFITKRVLTKLGTSSNITNRSFTDTELLRKVAAGYNGYRVSLLEKVAKITATVTCKRDAQSRLYRNRFEDSFLFGEEKTASPAGIAAAVLGLLPLAHLYGANVRAKRAVGEPISTVDSFVESNPNFAASMAAGLARLGLALTGEGRALRGLDKTLATIL